MIWLLFGIMLLCGALIVALPFMRVERSFGLLPASAILVVVTVSVLLYAKIGSPGAESGAAAVPDVDEMVAGLERRLAENPNDVAGWQMLGRSYVHLKRYDEAVTAFEQALERDTGNNGQTLADLGEAVLFDMNGAVGGRAAELFESALSAAPNNPKALFYGGMAAAERGDPERAAERWETLLATSPPPEIQDILQRGIAEWRGGSTPVDTPTPASGSAVATVDVSLGSEAGAAVPDDATVFVIARDPAQPSPPLAAVRRRVSELPDTVALSDADAMIPGRQLSAFSTLEIVARVSMSGGPIEQSGDWYGAIELDTATSRQGTIVIDRIVE